MLCKAHVRPRGKNRSRLASHKELAVLPTVEIHVRASKCLVPQKVEAFVPTSDNESPVRPQLRFMSTPATMGLLSCQRSKVVFHPATMNVLYRQRERPLLHPANNWLRRQRGARAVSSTAWLSSQRKRFTCRTRASMLPPPPPCRPPPPPLLQACGLSIVL